MDPTQQDPNTFTVTLDDGLPKPVKYGAATALAYHGYKRNKSVFWAFVWSAMGFAVPVIAVPVAVAQGFGKER